MRITGRQLRQIIQEEVERMMSEADAADTAFSYDPKTGKTVVIDPKTGKPYPATDLGRFGRPPATNKGVNIGMPTMPTMPAFGQLAKSPDEVKYEIQGVAETAAGRVPELESKLRSDIKAGGGGMGVVASITKIVNSNSKVKSVLSSGRHSCEILCNLYSVVSTSSFDEAKKGPVEFYVNDVLYLAVDGRRTDVVAIDADFGSDSQNTDVYAHKYTGTLSFNTSAVNGTIAVKVTDINIEEPRVEMVSRDFLAKYKI